MVDSLNAVPEDIKQPSPQEIKKLFTELRGSDKITPEMKALMKETLMHKKHETYKDDLKKIYFAFYSSPAGNVKKEDQVKAFGEWIKNKGNLTSLGLTSGQNTTDRYKVELFSVNCMLFAEGKQIQKDSKEGQELFKLLVEFDYLYMSEHTPFSDFEKFKKDLKKMLVINGQEVTPEADGAGYKNLGTASGMAEYKFSGLLPTGTGEYADKLTKLKGDFYLRSEADEQATYFQLKDKTTFADTSDHHYQVATVGDHLTLNGLLAYEIGGRTALGTSKETQLKKESPNFSFDKEKTKENIHNRLSKISPEVTFDAALQKEFFTVGFPNYMKGYNLETELKKAFLLKNDVESSADLKTHTRKLVLQDETAIQDIGQNIEWDFETEAIALNPKEKTNPTKITLLGKEFEVTIHVDMTTNKLHITWDKENLEALKDHVIKGFQKNIETLNRATFTDTEKVPSLTKTAQTWTDAAGISQPSAQSYDATQTKVSFARGYVTPFIAESKKPPQQQIDLVLMPNADASQISPLDNYGGAAATVAVKGLDGKKIKSTITVKTDDEGSKLEIKGEKSGDRISGYKYLDFQGDSSVVQKLDKALVTVTANQKVLYVDKVSKKTIATFPVVKGDDPETGLEEQGYGVDVDKLKDEVKAEHFYHLFSMIPEGPGAVNQSMIHAKFDTRFQTYKDTNKGKEALKGSIIDGRFHKVSADQSMLTFATEVESLPSEISTIQKSLKNYLSGVEKVYDTMKSAKHKIAGELGTDRFMVDGWEDFDFDKSENPAILKIIDGDGKEVAIKFKIKSGDISLDGDQTVSIAGVERKVVLKKGDLEFIAVPKKK